jgi:hypothetical protein
MSVDPKIINVNTRTYPNMNDMNEGVTVHAVLVAGDIGDYACYVGSGSPEWVARFGDKISFKEATCHFPVGLEEGRYRL